MAKSTLFFKDEYKFSMRVLHFIKVTQYPEATRNCTFFKQLQQSAEQTIVHIT